ncbi:hypothetical protein EV175_003972 [Coemansia sp. RSA 1933]|nr:hypothetical protein EV175_003972 [Coemansia sp. RSA 1933]
MTSTCRNGASCPFRHSSGARDTQEVCPSFAQSGECPQDDCGKRHTEKSAGRTTKPPSEVPCRNEASGGTCTRADCIFKHERPQQQQQQTGGMPIAKGAGSVFGAGRPQFRPTRNATPPTTTAGNNLLSARAKVFVPQTKVPQNRPKTFGNMEWTPAGASEPTKQPVRPSAWVRPTMASGTPMWRGQPFNSTATKSTFFNKSDVSMASSAESDGMDVDSFQSSNFAQPSKPAVIQQTTPRPNILTTSQHINPATSQWNQPIDNPPARIPAAPKAERKEVGPSSIPTIYDILGITEDTKDTISQQNRGRSNHIAQQPSVEYSVPTYTPKLAASSVSVPKANGSSSESLKAVNTMEEDRLQADTASSGTNSPASRVCYASEFDSYMDDEEDKEQERETDDRSVGPIAIEDVTNEMAAEPSLPQLEVVRPTRITTPTPEEPLTSAKEPMAPTKKNDAQMDTPKPVSRNGSGSDRQGLPKMLSFQEIMERKRRKKAAAEAEAAAATSSAQPTEKSNENEPLPLVGKRRIIDDNNDEDGAMESDASEGKRRKSEQHSTPRRQHPPTRIKNYVAMFEKELEDLSAGLSGPLQNSPASDRISRANINDTYIDTDLSQLLG